MKNIRKKLRHWWSISFVCIPLAVQANAIIPYMVVPWGQVLLLPILIIIEGYIFRRLLGGNFRSALFQSFVANLASTLLGMALYLTILPLVGDNLYYWWFKGDFSSQAIRNASIAILLAIVLWTISWLSETLIVSRMRKAVTFKEIAFPCALVNISTYALLLIIALWFGREKQYVPDVDITRNSTNIESLLRVNKNSPYVGFWKTQCTDEFGLAIDAIADGKYTVAFCGPGGCDGSKSLEHTALTDDPRYRIIDQNTIAIRSHNDEDIHHRCGSNR